MRFGFALPYSAMWWLHRAAVNARRQDRTWRYLLWSALAALLVSGMVYLAATFAILCWYAGLWWLSLIILGWFAAPNVAGLAVRHALVPLGSVRGSFYAGYIAHPGPDAEAFALCCAAWACAHRPTGGGEAWLARRRAARVPLGDAEVVMTALLAAGRGDADTARRLLRSLELMVEVHPTVRELAGEWLAVDAAARGAWAELADDAARARWPATPLGFFLEGIAQRRTGAAGAPGALELQARWLLAPHRRATRALRAEAEPPPGVGSVVAGSGAGSGAGADATPSAEAAAGGPLPRAVAAHLAFGAAAPSADRLAEAVRAWDAALLDGSTQTWLSRRALELDAPLGAVDRALRELAASVTDELARAADTGRLGAPPAAGGPIGEGLARRLRHGRLDALEQGFTRWAERRHGGAQHPAIDEWREFVALRAAYADAVASGGLELRRLAFPHAFAKGTSMAVWLWNERREYALSHAISRWLLDEALAVGDTAAIEHGHRNCSLDVHTRLGPVTEDTRRARTSGAADRAGEDAATDDSDDGAFD